MKKPTAIEEYNKYMSGVDRLDQFLSYYSFNRRGRTSGGEKLSFVCLMLPYTIPLFCIQSRNKIIANCPSSSSGHNSQGNWSWILQVSVVFLNLPAHNLGQLLSLHLLHVQQRDIFLIKCHLGKMGSLDNETVLYAAPKQASLGKQAHTIASHVEQVFVQFHVLNFTILKPILVAIYSPHFIVNKVFILILYVSTTYYFILH